MDFKNNFFTSGVDALMELGDTSTLVSKEVLSSRDGPRVAADGMDVLLGCGLCLFFHNLGLMPPHSFLQ